MDDTTIVSENVEVVQTRPGWSAASWSGLSWGGVIAGVFTAIAVSIILIALGSGIGFSLISPYSYSSPSAGTMTIIGAVWLVFAQAVGFATGGYVAGRLRRDPAPAHNGEVTFRDGAAGLTVWAVAVVASSLVLTVAAARLGAGATSTGVAGIAAAGIAGSPSASLDYYTDALLRTNPTAANNNSSDAAAAAPSGGSASGDQATRAEVGRILVGAIKPNGLSSDDRSYLAQIVSARTGASTSDAQQRVDTVIGEARKGVSQAAEQARKAAAYLSFWTFMSLLFGAVCATLGGMLGGELRDDFSRQRLVPSASR